MRVPGDQEHRFGGKGEFVIELLVGVGDDVVLCVGAPAGLHLSVQLDGFGRGLSPEYCAAAVSCSYGVVIINEVLAIEGGRWKLGR